jgi:hypothetical protein
VSTEGKGVPMNKAEFRLTKEPIPMNKIKEIIVVFSHNNLIDFI